MDRDNKSSANGRSDRKSKTVYLRPRRVDYPRIEREQHREEYAAEVAPIPVTSRPEPQRSQEAQDQQRAGAGSSAGSKTASGSKTAGYIGLGLGIASLFMFSLLLGPAAAVIGFYAYSQGQKTLGAWSIGLGLLSAVSQLLMIPFAR